MKKAPKKAEPKKPAGKRPVDKGKVVALHKAGWTVKNIAGDITASEETVEEVLNDWREGRFETTEETETEPEEDYA
jgi:hypothetical protein